MVADRRVIIGRADLVSERYALRFPSGIERTLLLAGMATTTPKYYPLPTSASNEVLPYAVFPSK